MSALAAHATDQRWIAWRNEPRGKDAKPTKVPYGRGGKAKADDPTTWVTRAEAETIAARIINGSGGGIGFELGDVAPDLHLAGLDLDSCLRDGEITPWAGAILEVIAGTYAEVSPSGGGLKAFFYIATDDVRWFLDQIGVPPTGWGCRRDVPGEDARDHGPAVEFYAAVRYFAVTENRWPAAPDRIRLLDRDDLERLGALVPPPASKTGNSAGTGGDKSRSAAAFRLGARLRRAGKSYEEMVAALHADPNTAQWTREKGEPNGQRELRRIWDKADPNPAGLPTIVVIAGLRHATADAGLAALAAGDAELFQRGTQIVRVCRVPAKTSNGQETTTPGILAVTYAALGRELGRTALWQGYDRKGNPVRIDPPRPVVEQILDMAGEWPFPVLAGVIGAPTMRPDGSLLIDEGYDEQTGLVLLGAPPMPAIPDAPTKEFAERAINFLDALLDEFPFSDGGKKQSVDRAVALSQLLTPVLRGAMPTAPLHLANAPTPGTGKSYLADIAATIATGDRAAVVSFSTPEETEKRLVGEALFGRPIIALDNASGEIQGDFLCQITERPLLALRPLGTSKMARVGNTFCVFANGNNAVVAADMVRRTIECRLDANLERPETREFRGDPLAKVMANRGAYIAAALIVARAYLCAGKPGRLPPFNSYTAWSDLVRSPLVWLGRADPVESSKSLGTTDPERLKRAAIFRAWFDALGAGGLQTADVINRANDRDAHGAAVRPALRDALLDVARDGRGELDSRRVGKWLSKNENNIADGLKLTCDRGDAKRPRWIVARNG